MSGKKEKDDKNKKDPVGVDASVDQIKKVVDRLKKLKKGKKKK